MFYFLVMSNIRGEDLASKLAVPRGVPHPCQCQCNYGQMSSASWRSSCVLLGNQEQGSMATFLLCGTSRHAAENDIQSRYCVSVVNLHGKSWQSSMPGSTSNSSLSAAACALALPDQATYCSTPLTPDTNLFEAYRGSIVSGHALTRPDNWTGCRAMICTESLRVNVNSR